MHFFFFSCLSFLYMFCRLFFLAFFPFPIDMTRVAVKKIEYAAVLQHIEDLRAELCSSVPAEINISQFLDFEGPFRAIEDTILIMIY